MGAATGNGTSGEADVLIIGSGPAGAVAAKHLAERGFGVVCLEQGEWVNASDFPGDRPEFELLAGKAWHPNPNVRGGPSDYPVDTSESDVNPLLFNGVGGSTILYAGHWMRFLPSDFRVRSLDGVADDWPFGYYDLLPYYEQVDRDVGAAGLGGDPAYPESAPPPLPPHPITYIGRKVGEGMNKLGWHWWPATNSIVTEDYGNLKKCVRHGLCHMGCPNGAKASFDLTHWPKALEHGARLITGARVYEISVDDRGLATGANWIDRKGVQHHQRAKVVVLAANSIGNARLLLLSTSSRFPDGLANSSGLVGKRLMMHPFATVVGVFDDEFPSWQGPLGQWIHSLEFYETDDSRGFVRGAKWGLMPTGGPLGAALSPFLPEDAVIEPNFNEHVRERLGHSAVWGIISEDLPLESNRVVLDRQNADSDGIPGARLIYKSDANSEALLAFHVERAKESLDAAGARETIQEPLVRDSGWHLIGTTRMGDDPTASVVDQYGRTHDVPNLYVYGASTFPTSSGLNPTATISAVSLRSAEHLAKHARLQEVPA
jgi:choline dehydrogenase-like flavoprotein